MKYKNEIPVQEHTLSVSDDKLGVVFTEGLTERLPLGAALHG